MDSNELKTYLTIKYQSPKELITIVGKQPKGIHFLHEHGYVFGNDSFLTVKAILFLNDMLDSSTKQFIDEFVEYLDERNLEFIDG